VDRQKIFIISVVVLSAALILGSLIYTKTSTFKPKPNQQVNQSVLSSSPPVVCKRFTSLDEALKNVEIACVLDLSNQNLATVSTDIKKLTKLNELSLKNNKLTEFPSAITGIPTLVTLDLSNNQIRQFPQDFGKLIKLQSLTLTGNNISESEKTKLKQLFPNTGITF